MLEHEHDHQQIMELISDGVRPFNIVRASDTFHYINFISMRWVFTYCPLPQSIKFVDGTLIYLREKTKPEDIKNLIENHLSELGDEYGKVLRSSPEDQEWKL